MPRAYQSLCAALLLTACGREPSPPPAAREGGNECVTRCGLKGTGLYDSCGELQEAEDLILEKFAGLYAPAAACSALAGTEVRVTAIDRPDMTCDGSPCFGGYRPDLGIIVLPREGRVALSAFPHEVVHVLDFTLGGFEDFDHATFEPRGANTAVESVWDAVYASLGVSR